MVAGKQVVICCTGRPLGLKAVKRLSILLTLARFRLAAGAPLSVANLSAAPSANNKVVVSDDSTFVTLLAEQTVRQIWPRRTPRR